MGFSNNFKRAKDMIRFLYPVVEPTIYTNDNENCYMGCFIAANENDSCLKDQNYVFAAPNISRAAKTAISFVESEIIKEKKSAKTVFDCSTKSAYGESMGLAYLLAKINCSIPTCWETNAESADLLCTGSISMLDNKPFLKAVSQKEFQTKLTFFIRQTEYNVFIVPELNLDAKKKKEKNEEEIHLRQLLKEKNIPILSLTEFKTSKNKLFNQKIVVTVAIHELFDLIYFIFPKLLKEKKSKYYKMAIWFICICCMLSVCLIIINPDYNKQLSKLEIELTEKFLLNTSVCIKFGHTIVSPFNYDETISDYENTLEKIPKGGNTIIANSLKLKGDIAFHCGLYSKAHDLLENCLEIRKKLLPEGEDLLADTYYSLATLYKYQGIFNKSIVNYNEALSIYEEISGIDKSKIVDIYFNLAEINRVQFNYTASERFYNKAKEVYKNDYIKNAEININLALLYLYKGTKSRSNDSTCIGYHSINLPIAADNGLKSFPNKTIMYNTVESLVNNALEIYNKKLTGDKLIPVIEAQMILALIYDLQNNEEKAKDLYKDSLNIIQSKKDADILIYTGMLNIILHNRLWEYYQYNATESFCIETIQILKEHFRNYPILLACTHNIIAKICILQKKYVDAESLCEKALEIFKKKLGEDHLMVVETLKIKAAMYSGENAEELYKKALGIYTKEFGKDSPFIVDILNKIANEFHQQKKYFEEIKLYHQALEIYENAYGIYDPPVVKTKVTLEKLYRSQNEYGKAEPLYLFLLRIYGCGLEYKKFSIFKDMIDLFDKFESMYKWYNDQKEYTKAEVLLNMIVEVIEFRKEARKLNNFFYLIDKLKELEKNYKNEFFFNRDIETLLYNKTLGFAEKRLSESDQGYNFFNPEGEIVYQRIVEIYENYIKNKNYKNSLYEASKFFISIYKWCYYQKDYTKADFLYNQFLMILRTEKKDDYSDYCDPVIDALEKMADDYYKRNKQEISKTLYEKISEIYKAAYGKDYKLKIKR